MISRVIFAYLTRETKAGRHTGHCCGDEVVEIAVRRSCQFQRAEADIVQGLVVDTVRLVGVFNQLVDGQCRVVWLDDCVGNLQVISDLV